MLLALLLIVTHLAVGFGVFFGFRERFLQWHQRALTYEQLYRDVSAALGVPTTTPDLAPDAARFRVLWRKQPNARSHIKYLGAKGGEARRVFEAEPLKDEQLIELWDFGVRRGLRNTLTQ